MKPIQLIKPNIPWSIEYSTSKEELKRPNGKLQTNIPCLPKSLNMILCNERVSLKDKKEIIVSLSVSCKKDSDFTRPDTATNTGTAKESVRICIIKSMYGEYNRWFSNKGIELKIGKLTLSIPLEPGDENYSEWCSVYGKSPVYNAANLNGFKQCMIKPVQLAIIFGGGNHYGHGVSMTKPNEAKITFNSLLIK